MKANKNSIIWMCNSCGNEFGAWSGKCSYCGEWNTIKEVKVVGGKHKNSTTQNAIEVLRLSEIETDNHRRISTGVEEMNRVLGGGIVPGSVILLGGEPGIGKSTLLLQLCQNICNVLYVSGEESLHQIKSRADRIGVKESGCRLVASGDLLQIKVECETSRPALLIIDSIQTVYLDNVESSTGSVSQVKECGIFLQRLAKQLNIPVLIIGHVTKEGDIAGPRLLEHIVDVVLYLEGDRFNDARILRGVKNRFGATNEVGIFSLDERGMTEIKNPSELFLSEKTNLAGSVVTAMIEGTRPILIEVQALVTPTNFGYPKRTSSGFDLNRLNLLAAVITKKTNINLSNCDIYLNIVGGIKVIEPAVDLAVCVAIISSQKNIPAKENICIFGEVGLSGEVRRVVRQKEREKEAKNLGYTLPKVIKNVSEIKELLVS
ncbi:MAG: DNA repair protein RadA [Candidatus Berkelbacteria bacterium]